MKAYYLLPLLLLACTKDEPRYAKVSFEALCNDCTVSYGINGTEAGTNFVDSLPFASIHAVEVGTPIYLTGRPLIVTDTPTVVLVKVDGFQHRMEWVSCMDSSALDRTLEIRFDVPALDKYGQPE